MADGWCPVLRPPAIGAKRCGTGAGSEPRGARGSHRRASGFGCRDQSGMERRGHRRAGGGGETCDRRAGPAGPTPRALRCPPPLPCGEGNNRGAGLGTVHDPVRTGRGTRDGGRVMTGRDRRALMLGGAVVIGALLVLRVVPWGVRGVLGAETGLRERATL